MRVCFVGRAIHPPWCDVEASIGRGFIDCLRGKAELSLLTMINNFLFDSQSEEELRIFQRGLSESIFLRNPMNYHLDSTRLMGHLIGLTKRRPMDIVQTIGVDPVLSGLFHRLFKGGRRTILGHLVYQKSEGEENALKHVMRRKKYGGSIDYILTTTLLLRDWLLRSSNLGFTEDRVFIIPPPIDCNYFKPSTGEDTSSQDPSILFLGSLNEMRFPHVDVLEAIQLLKEDGLNPRLSIISRGFYASDTLWIKRIAKKAKAMGLEGNVKVYIRRLHEEDKLRLYTHADAVIFPFKEFVAADPPITMLEAMACGNIVIATGVQSFPRILKDGVNGVLLDGVTPDRLAEGIRFAHNRERSKHTRMGARETILNHFSLERASKELFEVFNRLIDEERC